MIEKLPCITWSSRLVPYKTAWDISGTVGEIAGGKANATYSSKHPPVITIRKREGRHVPLPNSFKIAGIDCIRTIVAGMLLSMVRTTGGVFNDTAYRCGSGCSWFYGKLRMWG